MKRTLKLAYVATVCSLGMALSLGVGKASANIMYSFSGVTFNDGGTLAGTFTTNDLINSLVTFDITTTTGSVVNGFHYTTGTVGSGSTALPSIIVLEPGSLEEILQVTFSGGLTATGASILIDPADSFEQGLPGSPPNNHRNITAGEAVVATSSVPEPSTIALAGVAALAGLMGVGRRRRRA